MSIGSGIFASTLLVLIALGIWRISVNHKWRLVGKVAGVFVTLSLIAVGVMYGYAEYTKHPRPLDGLDGFKLGMSELDVRLLKGVPAVNSQDFPASKSLPATWLYNDASGVTKYIVAFDAGRLFRVCREAKEASEFGFYYGASESEVTEKLGRPSNISIDKDGLRKTLSFSKYRAAFEFGAGQSLELCAMGNGKVQFREEYVHDGSTSGTTK